MTDAAAELEAPAPAIAELASNMPAALGADALAVPGLREEHGREEPALAVPGSDAVEPGLAVPAEAVAGADVEADRRGVARLAGDLPAPARRVAKRRARVRRVPDDVELGCPSCRGSNMGCAERRSRAGLVESERERGVWIWPVDIEVPEPAA